MGRLKKAEKKEELKLVGVYLPLTIHNKLVRIAKLTEVSKSKLARTIIVDSLAMTEMQANQLLSESN